MASTSNTKHERALLDGLQHAVHGLRAPFTCGGTLVPEQPVTLCFSDNTRIAVLRGKDTFEQERLLRPLVERCAAAVFGMGRKTRYDRTVRDALQIKAEGGAFSVLHFECSPQSYITSMSTRQGATLCRTRTAPAAATCSAPSSCACQRSSRTEHSSSSTMASFRPTTGATRSGSRPNQHASTGLPSSATSITRSSGFGEACA